MTDYLVGHGPKRERFKQVTDDTIIETNYGYEIYVFDDTKASVLLYNAILDIYNADEKTNYTDMSRIENLICDAIQGNGNILVCHSSHVQDLYDKEFEIRNCELSTQSLFMTLLSRAVGLSLLWVLQIIAFLRVAIN